MHVTINGQMTIIGIVSYGSSTCEGGHPPVMTRGKKIIYIFQEIFFNNLNLSDLLLGLDFGEHWHKDLKKNRK